MNCRKCRLAMGLLLPCLGWLVIAGCSSKPKQSTDTHPVKGKLTYDDGSPFAAGMIEFQPVESDGMTARGEIAPDGAFSLFTLHDDGQKYDGAKAGKYHVTIIPPMTESQTESPMDLRNEFTVEAKENDFPITVPKPRQR